MMAPVKLNLSDTEFSGLLRMAEAELRSVPEQVRYVLRQALERRGLLDTAAEADSTKDGDDGRA